MRKLLAVLSLSLTVTATTISPGTAQQRNWDGSYYNNNRSREYRNNQWQRWDAPVRGRYDPNSYDGRRTGQPRTCGSDFMKYDPWGVPYGPYCN